MVRILARGPLNRREAALCYSCSDHTDRTILVGFVGAGANSLSTLQSSGSGRESTGGLRTGRGITAIDRARFRDRAGLCHWRELGGGAPTSTRCVSVPGPTRTSRITRRCARAGGKHVALRARMATNAPRRAPWLRRRCAERRSSDAARAVRRTRSRSIRPAGLAGRGLRRRVRPSRSSQPGPVRRRRGAAPLAAGCGPRGLT